MNTDTTAPTETFFASAPPPVDARPVINIKRMFRLWAPLMRTVFILLAIPLAAAAWFLVPATYTATSEIRFLTMTPQVMSSPEAYRDSVSSYERFLNTQLSLITGNAILSRVLDEADIRALPCITQASDPLGMLRKCVSVHVERNSEMVSLTCTLPDRESPKRILDKVVSVYMDYALNEEASQGSDRLNILTKERDARQMELELQLQQIAQLQEKLGVPMVGDNAVETREGDLYRENMLRADEEVSRAETEMAEVQAQLEQIKSLQARFAKSPGDRLLELGIEERVNQEPRVAALREDLVRAEANLAHMSARMLAQSPQRREEEQKLNSLRASVAQVEKEARGAALDSLQAQSEERLKTLQKSVQEAKARGEKLTALLGDYNQRVENATSQLAELGELKLKAAATRSQLEDVRRTITDIGLEAKAPARVQLAARPFVPAGPPDYKQRGLMMAVALVFAAGCAFAAGLARELTDQHVRAPQDVACVTRLPVIGTIPHIKEDAQLPDKVVTALLTAYYPESTTADEYRRVLVRFLYSEEAYSEMKTTLIASPTEGDGKTSLACNIAIALAQANRSVLLVDVSERGPRIEKCFKLKRGPGLAEVLIDARSPEEMIRATGFKNIFVIGPGAARHELGSKLASRDMCRFLEWAEGEFDHVILDSPPSLIMSDAKIIAPIVDGVLVVVGVGVSTLGMLRRCLLELQQVGARVEGLVVNGLRHTRGGYMAKNSKAYYGYAKRRDLGLPEDARKETDEEEAEAILLPNAPEEDAPAYGQRQYRHAWQDQVEEEDEPIVFMPYDEEPVANRTAEDHGDAAEVPRNNP